MERYEKDPELEGIYVKRCKCGARPYYDRICVSPVIRWIKCNYCDRTGKSDNCFQTAIDNWNYDILAIQWYY